ncbi:uncharacterized protein LOC132578666 [Heteronotia binoei]|uniref:uncharacterized protein LOC132578666 n=1 Tax=Heteronotia binoei TaxID=13085 RepID=UPI0029312D4B|nr:uncharacterized protein LOC132578666 [Heteronotia binoei]
MGGSQSTNTPLECMLQHFVEGFVGNLGEYDQTPGLLRIFCESEWPTFGVGWPPEGTFSVDIAQQVHSIVVTPPGDHPDQYSYIDSWLSLLQNPPPWLKQCMKATKTVLLLKPRGKPTKGGSSRCSRAIGNASHQDQLEMSKRQQLVPKPQPEKLKPIFLPSDQADCEWPPPYVPAVPPLGPQQQHVPMAPLAAPPPSPTPAQSGARPALGAPERTVRTHQMTTRSQVSPALAREFQGWPGYSWKAPWSPTISSIQGRKSRERSNSLTGPLDFSPGCAVRVKTQPAENEEVAPPEGAAALPSPGSPLHPSEAQVMPLRQIQTPQFLGAGGQVQGGESRYIYTPFSSADLLNWKTHVASYTEKPEALTSLLTSIMGTHCPTYLDCQQLFLTLFTTEERQRIFRAAKKKAEEATPADAADRAQWLAESFPDADPSWDPNDTNHMRLLRAYRGYLLAGMQEAAKKATNMSKIAEVLQRPDEAPGAFLERLYEAYRLYSPFDPEKAENQRMVNCAFVSQSAGDIKRKLQKQEGFAGMNISQLLEIAQKVFVNREQEAKRAEDKKIKMKAALLAAAIGECTGNQGPREGRRARSGPRPQTGPAGPGPMRPPLARNECAFCRELGHWRESCPKRNQMAPPRPLVTMKVGGQELSFMIDTGAEFSVVNTQIAPVTKQTVPIAGATGRAGPRPFLQERICNLGSHLVQHKFLYVPECPVPLLGRDILSKLRAAIHFEKDGRATVAFNTDPAGMYVLTCPLEEEWRLFQNPPTATLSDEWASIVPGVWAEDNPPGLARNHAPITIELQPGAQPVRLRQYPIPWKAIEGIQKHLDRLLKYGILKECQSPWNTPLLPVQKPGTGEFRPCQDLRAVNKKTVTLHPVVPNPYVLLGLVPQQADYFSVLDLKDAFFCLRIAPASQPIFAFQWQEPGTGRKLQYTWTRLPQGFKNSPTLFSNALAQDLQDFDAAPGQCVLIQYADDLLIAALGQDRCYQATLELLDLLWKAGYKVSREKAQLCQAEVKYLGFHVSQGTRALGHERKEAVCALPEPTSRRQVREFLGAAGFCRVWIPNFALIAKPLYEATKGGEKEPFLWTPEQTNAFKELKRLLMEAPALGLPDVEKPFTLFVHERNGVAIGVLTQALGSWQRPVAYLSKQLDSVAKGWPGCLRAIAAAAELIKEADKLTLGQELEVKVPHAVLTLMDYKGNYWFTNSRMTKYQAMMCENPRLRLTVTGTLNPASLLPISDQPVDHDCIQTMDEVYSSRPDLTDAPLPSPDVEYYTDGSSYVQDGHRYAGYAVVTHQSTVEARPLPPGTSAQKAELIALTRALELAEGVTANIYTDSKYAFLTLHAHGALYKEKGLMNSAGKAIRYSAEILRLLEAVWAPRKVSVMHCRAHQKPLSPVSIGNRKADEAAKQAAMQDVDRSEELVCPIFQVPLAEWTPRYSAAEESWATAQGTPQVRVQGWIQLPDKRLFVPEALAWPLVVQAHEGTHFGKTALAELLDRQLYIPKLHSLCEKAALRCVPCARNNPRQGPSHPPGIQHTGTTPFECIITDFTEMPRSGCWKYLLVFVCTYSNWIEAFPTRTEKAAEVVKHLLKSILPFWGLPVTIGSDNGPAYIHKVVQEVSRVLHIDWRLHAAYRPQSSGKCERANRSIKAQLSKLCQETSLKWPDALPIALFRLRCLPKKGLKLSPYEIVFGRPPPIVKGIKADPAQIGNLVWFQEIQSLGKAMNAVSKYVLETLPLQVHNPVHPFQPGDTVWVKVWRSQPLQPKWRGPFTVLLSTPTAIKVQGLPRWIHWTHVKRAAPDWQVQPVPGDGLKLRFSRT